MAQVKDLLVQGQTKFLRKAYFQDQIVSNVAQGTAPLVVASSTVVSNLNSDYLDGYHASGLFTALSANSTLSITIGGTTLTSSINAATVDGKYISNYYTKSEADDRFVNVAGDTMTGALTVKQYIFGYNYNHAGANAPAFVFDKPGSNYTGIGANGEADTIYFSAATFSNGEASWVTSYKQKWKFNGTIYQENNAVIHSGNIGSQSVSYASSAGNADTVDGYHIGDLDLRYTRTGWSFCSPSDDSMTGSTDLQDWVTNMYNQGGYKGYSSITVGSWWWVRSLDFSSPVGTIRTSGAMIVYSGDGSNNKNYKHFLVLDAYAELYGITSNEESWKFYSRFLNNRNYTDFVYSKSTSDSRYLRKDTNDSTPYQYSFTKTDDHAIQVGTIRGRAVGSQTGEYIHIYERVHIGSPSGWGSRNAPSYGLSTYGGAWLATDTGNVTIGGTNQLASAWGSFNLTVGKDTNKVVIGYLNSSTNGVVVGGHNNALSEWAPLNIAGTTLYFRINETIKAALDSNGNFGIGTSTPGYKLHVNGTSYLNGETIISNSIKILPTVWSELFNDYGLASDYTSRYNTEEFLKSWVKYAYAKGAGYTVMSYISPNARGYIVADVYASGINSSSGLPEHITGRYYQHGGDCIIFGTSYGTWYYRTGLDSGNYTSYLGYIGTTAVQASSAAQALTGITAFTFNGTSPAGTNYITGSAGRIYFGGNFHIDSLGSNATYINHYTANNVYLVSGSSQGNVGIGTTSPNYKLQISGDSYTTGWSRAANGFYVEGNDVHFTHQGNVGEIDMTSNNEFLWGSSSATLYFNWRTVSRGTTVNNYIWNAGSSTSWASHNMGNIWLNGSEVYLRLGPQNSSHAHYDTNASVSHWFNKRVDVNGDIWRYGTNYGISSDGYFYAKGVYANRDGASTYGGVSLYSTSDPITEYGIAFRDTGNYGKIGRVQGDWATYFTMDSSHNRGWIFRSGGTNYASVSARGEAYFNSVGTDNYIAYPSGGFFSSDGSTTGYIIITIPANYRSCTMMRFNVEIYNYSTGTSTTYTIGGYNYTDGNWYNVFAYANRQGTTGYGNLTVRFGHNGTNSIIWIGESNTSYSYPKVRITNVTLGYSNADYNTWASGWSVTIATTAPTNVSQTVTNPATNYYAESAGSVAWGNVTGKPFNWSGQSGQPTWLWGSNDGTNYYVWNPSNFNVNYANTAERANYLSGHSSNPDNSHPGYGAKVFYSWNIGSVGNDTAGYSTGITIGSHPSDTGYGFQIVQNLWDDRTYTRRYNGGWQDWKTLAWTSDIPTKISQLTNDSGYITSSDSCNYATSAGNADTVDNMHASNFSYNVSSDNYDCNNLPYGTHSATYRFNGSPLNAFPNSSWSNMFVIGAGSDTMTQIGAPYNADELYFRRGTWDSGGGSIRTNEWKAILHSGNYTSYVNNYYWANVKISTSSNTGTYPTFGSLSVINDSCNNSTDALAYFQHRSNNDWTVKIDSGSYDYGLYINTTGNYALSVGPGAARFAGSMTVGADATPSYTLDVRGTTRSTDRIYANEWIQFDNVTGLYWPNTNGAHLYANTTTSYAALITQGSRGGYCGLQCGPSANYMTVMSTDTHHGLYCENTGTWEFYYNRSNDSVGIRTSSNLGYDINLNGSVGSNSSISGVGFVHTSYNSASYLLTSNGGVVNESKYLKNFGSSNYVTFTVDGDANTYYPVRINKPADYYPYSFITISRGYYETAPDTWYTSTHKGGLSMCLFWNSSSYWDGNSSGEECFCVRLNETYCNMVAGMDRILDGTVVWLRGGGAVYHIHGIAGTSQGVTVYLESYTDGASRTFSPRTWEQRTPVSVRWPGYADGADYASSAGSVTWGNVTGKPFNWSGQSGQPTWLWGSNDGTNYYVWNPSNFNVNYANSAGSARQLTSLGAYTYSNLSTDIPTNAVSYKIVASGGAVLGDSQYNVLHIPWSLGDWGTYLLFGANNGRFGIKFKHTGDVRELPTILTTSSSNVTSLDCKKYSSIYVTRSSTQTMTLSTTPNEGMECHIVIYNSGSSNITITLPSSYRKNVTSITIAPGAFGEVNVMTINSIVHVRAV